MKYLTLLAVFVSGCASNIYAVKPEGNSCVRLLIRNRNYCISEIKQHTEDCLQQIKLECKAQRKGVIVIKEPRQTRGTRD
jgi:hypothetical protein